MICQYADTTVVVTYFACIQKAINTTLMSLAWALHYGLDHAPSYTVRACEVSSQRTRARATRCFTILITMQLILPNIHTNNLKKNRALK